jgi:hypothetical protein
MKKLELFGVPSSESAALSAQAGSDFAKLFFAHKGRKAHKWIHYLDIYDRHFAKYRNTAVRMLEIGVAMGGSLEIWRKYLGPDAAIFGVDVVAACANYVTPPNQVRIGSQADKHFMRSVVAELGTPDIIVDDGSHIGRHQRISFETLFPLLREGGLYVIEDLHASYFIGSYEGGYRRRGTGVEYIKQLIDDLHAWYHGRNTQTPARDWIRAIHVYDSMVVIEKGKVERPSHIIVG